MAFKSAVLGSELSAMLADAEDEAVSAAGLLAEDEAPQADSTVHAATRAARIKKRRSTQIPPCGRVGSYKSIFAQYTIKQTKCGMFLFGYYKNEKSGDGIRTMPLALKYFYTKNKGLGGGAQAFAL